MCSIAGEYPRPAAPASLESEAGFRLTSEALAARVERMLREMPGRGPDGVDVAAAGDCVIGHGRLAIRDLSPSARQPMATPCGRYHLVFNGEIYNCDELRALLAPFGITYKTTGDTEVLLHALANFGDGVLARLNGEFAIAFFDTATRRLLLARDSYGVKPLAYIETAEGFTFASEPRGLLRPAGPAPRIANDAAIARFLVENLSDDGEGTFFRDIRMVPGGHALVVLDGVVVEKGPYREAPHETGLRRAGSATASDLRAALEAAVIRRMVADVRVGASLSGGLDSGAILGVASRLHGPGFPTFTAAMPDPDLDESATAGRAAHAAGADATFAFIAPPTVSELSELVRLQGAPFGSLGVFASRRVAQATRAARVTVLIDGQGADEALGGYPHFRAARLATLLRRGRLLSFLREVRGTPSNVRKEALYLLLPRKVRSRLRKRAYAPLRARLSPELQAAHELSEAPAFPSRSILKGVLALTLTSTCLPGLLRYADRNTMAASVEGRYPYLDPNLVETAFALPDDALISDGWTKRALREASQGYALDEVRERKKKFAYAAPDRAWLTGPLACYFEEHLTDGRLDARGWLAEGEGARLHAAYREGRDEGLAFRAFILEAWARAFLDVPEALPQESLDALKSHANAAPR